MTAHNTLIMNSIKNLTTQKALIGTETFGGEKALLENKEYNSKVVIGSMFYCCCGAEVVQWKTLLM